MFVSIRARTWLAIIALLILNPVTWYFFDGIVDYQQGSPTLRFRGYPSFEAFNLDRATRASPTGSGCVIHGNEWIYQGMHNRGVRLMVKTFGPPAKSYAGVYPTKEEALQFIADAPLTPVGEFYAGKLRTANGSVTLDPTMVAAIVDGFWLGSQWEEPEIQVRCAEIDRQCLITRLTAPGVHEGTFIDLLILFDLSNGRPFAYYAIGEGWNLHFPPVSYN